MSEDVISELDIIHFGFLMPSSDVSDITVFRSRVDVAIESQRTQKKLNPSRRE